MKTYHWVLTAQLPGGRIVTADGVVNVKPGTSRKTVYGDVTRYVASKIPNFDGGIPVLFWSLDPESLA